MAVINAGATLRLDYQIEFWAVNPIQNNRAVFHVKQLFCPGNIAAPLIIVFTQSSNPVLPVSISSLSHTRINYIELANSNKRVSQSVNFYIVKQLTPI